jgi:flagellar M-ring protein FliF
MNGVFGNLLGALADIWKNIGVGQKVSIILIGLVSLGVIGGVLYFGSRPDWRILYADLDSKTAARVSDIIRDNNVAMKLTNGGRTVMVPGKDIYNMRLRIANEGIAVDSKGEGFELFDNMQLGLTDRQQQVAYQRAIQGELQRMITEVPGIVGSKVMVTLPPKSIFKKEGDSPTASVMLVMDRGTNLSSEQINSIRYMVASAVPGMTPDHVTITDNRGRLLRRQINADGAGGSDSGTRMEFQQRAEADLKEKAEAILRPIVGMDKVVAMVSCDVDFEKIDRVIESLNTEQATVVSEKLITDDAQRNSNPQGGAAGTASNRPTEVAVNNPGGEDPNRTMSEQRKTVERKFMIPKSMEKVSINGGRIRQMTVAVTVAYKGDNQPWSDEEMANFEKLVVAAVGADNYKREKGSRPVTVRQMPFAPVDVADVFKVPVTDQIINHIERFSSSGLIRPVAGMLVLMVLYGVFRKYFNRAQVRGADFGGGFDDDIYSEDYSQLDSGGRDAQAKALESAADALASKVEATPQSIAEFMENWMTQG